jgi:hypothetical protein
MTTIRSYSDRNAFNSGVTARSKTCRSRRTIAIEREALDPADEYRGQPLGQDRDAARFRPLNECLVASALIHHESIVVPVL